MATRSSKTRGLAGALSERQREWLTHVEAAEERGEALSEYAKRRGLSVSSLYEAKRRGRQVGAIPSPEPKTRPKAQASRFMTLAVRKTEAAATEPSLRIQLANGIVLEWSEAPRGEALRELVGCLA